MTTANSTSPLPPARRRAPGEHPHSWRMVWFAAIALGMTAPGQTHGVSVFVDPMMATLDLSRSQVSAAYLVGTLTGAVTMPWFGTLIDRRGIRFTLTVVAVAFAACLVGMAGVTGLLTLTLGFVGIRMLGQGAMTLTATDRRPGHRRPTPRIATPMRPAPAPRT